MQSFASNVRQRRGVVVNMSTSGPVTTWMGDCLLTGKPSRYVTNQLGQLSLPSLRGRYSR